MRRFFKSILLLGLAVGFTASLGCVMVTSTRCPRPSRPFQASRATDSAIQHRLSLYFSTMVSQKMWEAANKGLWSADAKQWMIRCPWMTNTENGVDPSNCPCGKPLCCCPNELAYEEFLRLLEQETN